MGTLERQEALEKIIITICADTFIFIVHSIPNIYYMYIVFLQHRMFCPSRVHLLLLYMIITSLQNWFGQINFIHSFIIYIAVVVLIRTFSSLSSGILRAHWSVCRDLISLISFILCLCILFHICVCNFVPLFMAVSLNFPLPARSSGTP